MTKITYPAPFSIIGSVGRKTNKPQRYEISQEVQADIPEVEAGSAPIVISLDMSWPLMGLESQSPHHSSTVEQRRRLSLSKNPTVKVRHHDGKYFAPVMIFEKDNPNDVPVPAKPADLADIGDHRRVWASGFEKPYEHQTTRGNHWESGTYLHYNHRQGGLMWAGDKRIKSLGDGQESRQEDAKNRALADIARYISIDGELWRSLEGEPVFRYKFVSDGVQINVTQDHELNTATGWGAFRLDRYQDCIDHINDLMETGTEKRLPVLEYFENVQILPGFELGYEDDAEAILMFAHETIRRLEKFTSGVGVQQTSLEMRTVLATLKDLIGRGKDERVDEIAQALESSRSVWSHQSFEAPGLEIALKRWDLRPFPADGPKI